MLCFSVLIQAVGVLIVCAGYEGKWAGMKPPKTIVAHQVANPNQDLRPYLLKALGEHLAPFGVRKS